MNALGGFAWGVLGFFGTIGPLELAVIAGIAVLIFGHRLPKVARSLGRGITEFKHGLKDVRDQADPREDLKRLDSDQAEPEAEPHEEADRPSVSERRARRARRSPRRRRREPEDKEG